MQNIKYYIIVALLILYIIKPTDLHPGFLDDLLALGALAYYYFFKSPGLKMKKGHYGKEEEKASYDKDVKMTLAEAYRYLGVDSQTPFEEIKKVYKRKLTLNHPDKVNHLSEELQEKAHEVTMRLNIAFELIKQIHSK
ncbi:MAG: DnaJ domain-containing protein [Candidatus Magnetoovum sp. WYHC-5]|nr:DnaJ domain-containing protein [Candidatus Magnetoovum sp. WYHC-5]